MEQLLLFVVALVANAFSAFAGGGAGLVQLPALIFLGLPFGVALATHKIASVALGIGAALRHLREGTVKLRFSMVILCCGIPGVIVGANVVLLVPDRSAEISLGILTAALGIYSWLRKSLGVDACETHRDRFGYIIGGAVLFFIGVLNGSLSSGTGLFVTVWLVRWFGLDFKSAVVYTLIIVGVFWNGAGALTLAWLGNVRWDWLPALIAGSLIGGYLGAHLAIVKGSAAIKRVFEVVALLIGVKLIIG